MTRVRAGPMPAQSPATPCSLMIFWAVSMIESFLMVTCFGADGSFEAGAIVLTACWVWMTQIGFEMIEVADPVEEMNSVSQGG